MRAQRAAATLVQRPRLGHQVSKKSPAQARNNMHHSSHFTDAKKVLLVPPGHRLPYPRDLWLQQHKPDNTGSILMAVFLPVQLSAYPWPPVTGPYSLDPPMTAMKRL